MDMTLCFPLLPQLLDAPVHGVSILSRFLKISKTALCLFAFTLADCASWRSICSLGAAR